VRIYRLGKSGENDNHIKKPLESGAGMLKYFVD